MEDNQMTPYSRIHRNERAPTGGDGSGAEVQSWMALQIAVHIRRTRRELHRVSARDLDRMGLARFDVETGRAM